MYPVSDRFLDAITRSGRRKSVVDLYLGGQLLAADIPVASGNIVLDRNSDSRASGSVTIASDDFDISLVQPFGTELVVRTGVVYDNNEEELVPMGVFRLNVDSHAEGRRKVPEVSFFDRAKAMMDTTITPDQDYSGRTSQSAISTLVDYSLPGMVVTYAGSLPNPTLPGGSIYSSNNWDSAKEIAQAMLGELYFNRLGDPVLNPIPSISTTTPVSAAVWLVDVGQDGVLISADRTISREGTFNGVGMLGGADSDNNRPYALVFDESPGSPTHYFGPFGRKTIRLENPILTTSSQCEQAAREQLKNYLGLSKSVNFKSLANPALDPGDIVLFQFFDDQELHLIDQLNIPLGTGEMSGSTRTVQFVA